MAEPLCPAGKPIPDMSYSCRFCHVRLHRGDSGCACSQMRPDVTLYSTLCVPCAESVDVLTAETVIGRVHRALRHEAMFTFARDDDS